MENRKPLWEDIKKFSKNRYLLVFLFLILALVGIVVPIIPGLALLVLAIALIKKGWMAKIRRRVRLWNIKSDK
jgi:uncharacterized protein YqgC (DUF456 family)